MAEQIGLEAVLKDKDFQDGLKRYLTGIGLMEKKTDTTTGKLGSAFDKVGTNLLKVAGVMTGAVVAGAGAAAAAMTKFAVDGTRAATDMEAQISNIAAVMGKTSKEIEPLSDLILDLAVDPRLKVTAVEAADAIELLARNGLSMTDILDGAAFATTVLANSTGTSFGNAANIATDAMAIFNIKASDMISAVDGIVSVTTNSKFSIDDFALALSNGGGVAASSGVSFDDFNTTIAAISPAFKSGMTAGTAFKNLLLRLAPTTDPARDGMRELGIITAEAGNRFFDAQGNLKSMAEVSQILQDALIGLSEEQRNLALRTIFGNDAMGAAIGLMNLGAESGEGAAAAFTNLQQAMGNTDSVESAAVRMDNLAGAVEILKGIIEAISLQVGNLFIPILRKLTGTVTEFVSGIGPRVIDIFGQIADKLDTFISAMIRGQSPVEAFRTTLATMVSDATLDSFDKAVDVIGDVLDAALDLGKWAIQHGPQIIDVVTGLAAAFLTFKTVTTAVTGVKAITASISAASATMAAAGGGASGLVALLGGPLVVAAGLAAAAVYGLVTASRNYNRIADEGEAKVRSQINSLRETSRATGDYTDEAQRLARALEISSTGWGVFTDASEQVQESLTSLIYEIGDFSGTNEQLEESLQAVFGSSIHVTDQFVLLDGRVVGATSAIRGMGEAIMVNKAAQDQMADAYQVGNELLQQRVMDQQAATAATSADNVARQAAIQNYQTGNELLRQQILTQQGYTLATDGSVIATNAENAARQEMIELSDMEIARRQDIANIIRDGATEQGELIGNLIDAHHELFNAQVQLSNAPFSEEMLGKVREAEAGVAEAFAAINESHRQMVFEIFVRNAQLGGSFDENAARIAVALGLVTEKEAALRVEAEKLTTDIGRVGDSLTQAFLEDGVISAKEATALSQVISDLENGVITADEALQAFATEGLGGLVSGSDTAKGKTKEIGDEFGKIPTQAEDAASGITTAFESEPWLATGAQIPDDIGQGIASKNKRPSDEADRAAKSTRDAFEQQRWDEVGTAIDEGVAAGITAGSGIIGAAAAAAVADALGAARAAAGIQSPSTVAADQIGLPFSEGIAVGIGAGSGLVSGAVGDVIFDSTDMIGDPSGWASVEIGWPIAEGIASGITSGASTVADSISSIMSNLTDEVRAQVDELFDIASGFSSLGGVAATRLQSQTLGPLQEQADNIDRLVEAAQSQIVEGLGLDVFNLNIGDLRDLAQSAPDRETGDAARRLLFLWQQQAQAQAEIREEQERISRLQQAQADLAFLEQQTKLLDLISEHGLDAGDILQGLALGVDADAGQLTDAMTRAIQAIIAQTEQTLGIASPSKVFKKIGNFITEGLAAGIAQKARSVTDMLDTVFFNPTIQTPQLPAILQSAPAQPLIIDSGGSVTNNYNLTANTRESGLSVRRSFSLMSKLSAP